MKKRGRKCNFFFFKCKTGFQFEVKYQKNFLCHFRFDASNKYGGFQQFFENAAGYGFFIKVKEIKLKKMLFFCVFQF